MARSPKKIDVKVGWFIIEHDATGRVIVLASRDVGKAIQTITSELVAGTSEFHQLQKLYSMDDCLRIHFTACDRYKDATAAVREYRANVKHDYLLLN